MQSSPPLLTAFITILHRPQIPLPLGSQPSPPSPPPGLRGMGLSPQMDQKMLLTNRKRWSLQKREEEALNFGEAGRGVHQLCHADT